MLADGLCRFEDDTGSSDTTGAERGDSWWYVRARDTGLVLCIKNPHIAPDDCGGDVFYAPTYDGLAVLDDGARRELNDDESDEYVDDVMEYLRHSDFS